MLSPQSLIVIVTPLTPVLIPLQTLDQVLRRLQTAAMQGGPRGGARLTRSHV